jgi:hypothetical protein
MLLDVDGGVGGEERRREASAMASPEVAEEVELDTLE